MKKIVVIMAVVLIIMIAACSKKPDNSIEQRMKDDVSGGSSTGQQYLIGVDEDTNSINLDTEAAAALKKKARDEYEQLNKEHLQNYEQKETIPGGNSDQNAALNSRTSFNK